MTNTNSIYDKYSNPYDKIQLNLSFYRELRDLHISFLDESQTILDAGAGTGNQTIELLSQGKTVYAIDINGSMMSYLFQKIMAPTGKLSVSFMDIEQLAFVNGSFDAVTAMNAVYNAKHPIEAMREAYRILKTNGIFLVSGPLPNADIDQITEHTIHELRDKDLLDKETAANVEIMRTMNKKLMEQASFYSAQSLEKILIRDIGFSELIYSSEALYLGNAYFVAAKK
jgi:ubiquinone/menaquinone biosynthesis C-methylase UbiE